MFTKTKYLGIYIDSQKPKFFQTNQYLEKKIFLFLCDKFSNETMIHQNIQSILYNDVEINTLILLHDIPIFYIYTNQKNYFE